MGWVYPLAGHLTLKWYFVSFENQSLLSCLASLQLLVSRQLSSVASQDLGRQAHSKTSSQLSLLIFGMVLFLGESSLPRKLKGQTDALLTQSFLFSFRFLLCLAHPVFGTNQTGQITKAWDQLADI